MVAYLWKGKHKLAFLYHMILNQSIAFNYCCNVSEVKLAALRQLTNAASQMQPGFGILRAAICEKRLYMSKKSAFFSHAYITPNLLSVTMCFCILITTSKTLHLNSSTEDGMKTKEKTSAAFLTSQ